MSKSCKTNIAQYDRWATSIDRYHQQGQSLSRKNPAGLNKSIGRGSSLNRPVEPGRHIVLLADLSAKTAELRMNPPENSHPYEDGSGRTPAGLYYQAYLEKIKDILNCTLVPIEWRPVV
jgi:hypothetical protein